VENVSLRPIQTRFKETLTASARAWVWGNVWRVAVDRVLIPILSAIAIILIALGEGPDSTGHVRFLPGHQDPGLVLGYGLVFTVAAGVLGSLRTWQNSLAATRLRSARLQLGAATTALAELTELELARIFADLRYATDERISLFVPADDKKSLVLLARHAVNHRFTGPGARTSYPTNQGCLGKAFSESKEWSINDLPDPQLNLPGWQTRLREDLGIPDPISAVFRMRSRCCIAFGIYPPLKPLVGVVVMESQQARGPLLEIKALRKRVKPEFPLLVRLIEAHVRLGQQLRAT
jgi:hypothetical protein